MRYLIVAHQTAGSPELRSWLVNAHQSDPRLSTVLLVPTAPRSYWKPWNVLEDRRIAEEQAQLARILFDDAGIPVERVSIGAHDPMESIDDELRKDRDFDAIVIATFPPGISRWLRRDLIHQASRRTGVRVVSVIATPVDGARAADGALEPATVAAGAAGGGTAPTATIPRVETAPPRDRGDDPAPGQAIDLTPTRFARTLNHVPRVADAFWSLRSQLEWQSGIEPQLGEFVALRVALRLRFKELWQEHVGIARALGISDARIVAIEHWASSEAVRFNDRERAVLAYVDAVCREGKAIDARDVLEDYLDQSQIIALTLMIGCYRVEGSFAHALNLGTDEPFVGWGLFVGEHGEQHL